MERIVKSMKKIRKRFLAVSALMLLGAYGGAPARANTCEFVDSATITRKVRNALMRDEQLRVLALNVETIKGTVQLSGVASSEEQSARAVQLARTVPGVRSISNEIRLK
jgi:osmotically-inducible protein OsmY